MAGELDDGAEDHALQQAGGHWPAHDRLVTTGVSTFGYVTHSLAGLRPWLLMLPDLATQDRRVRLS